MSSRPPAPTSLTRPACVIALVAGALYIIARSTGAGWDIVMLCALVAILIVAACWPGVSLIGVTATAIAPQDATVGRVLPIHVELTGHARGLKVRIVTDPDQPGPWFRADAPSEGQYELVPGQRGVFSDLVVQIRSSSPLGLVGWSRKVLIRLDRPIEVAPRTIPVQYESVRGADQRADAQPRSSTRGQEVTRGVREYVDGDAIRLVHWPSTARTGTIMIRELEGPQRPRLVVVVDLRGAASEAEIAASRASGLALSALAVGTLVDLATVEADGAALRSGHDTARGRSPPGPRGAGRAEPRTGTHGCRSPLRPRRTPRMSRAPEVAEDSKGFRIAILIGLMAAGGAAIAEGVGGFAAQAVVLVGYPIAFLIAYATRNHRPTVLRIIVTAGAFGVMITFAASLSSAPIGGVAALQVPLAEVFIWLLMVHAIDSPGRRALFITLLSGTVLMAVAGVLSLSMTIAPYLVVWAIAGIAALVLAHRSALTRLPALRTPAPKPGRVALSSALSVVIVLLVVAILGAGVFMIAPVAGTSRSLTFPAQLPQSDAVPVLGGLSNPSLGASDPSLPAQPGRRSARASFGYFGFSNQLDTATRGRPDNTLVMRVRASSPDFWRAQSFDTWDGRVWTASRTGINVVRGGQPIAIPRAADEGPSFSNVASADLVQTYYIERSGPNAIFAAQSPTKLYFSDRTIFQLPDASLRAGVQLDEGSVYTVVSRRQLTTEQLLRSSDPTRVPSDLRSLYAERPVTTNRVRDLAASVTAGATTTYDKVQALEAWMGANTKYTLNIPPLPAGRDAVDQFLFVDKQGFCEQIGTSLVVMLRSLGIPARLAVGYATGERNPFTGLYEVRAKDAHAWAEVYFPGVGWQAFDPTAQVPLAGDSSIDAAGVGALSYLNARIDVPGWVPIAFGALGLVIIASIGIRLLVVRLRRRAKQVDPSWAATRLLQLERLGARRGRARAPGETTPEYAARARPARSVRQGPAARDRAHHRRTDVLLASRGHSRSRPGRRDPRGPQAAVAEEAQGRRPCARRLLTPLSGLRRPGHLRRSRPSLPGATARQGTPAGARPSRDRTRRHSARAVPATRRPARPSSHRARFPRRSRSVRSRRRRSARGSRRADPTPRPGSHPRNPLDHACAASVAGPRCPPGRAAPRSATRRALLH